MRIVGFLAAALVAASVMPGLAGAHHAFSTEFDANQPITLKGTITRVEWINPHAWIHLDVPRDGGVVEKWRVEAGSPNTLVRRGLTRDSIPAGSSLAAVVLMRSILPPGVQRALQGSEIDDVFPPLLRCLRARLPLAGKGEDGARGAEREAAGEPGRQQAERGDEKKRGNRFAGEDHPCAVRTRSGP